MSKRELLRVLRSIKKRVEATYWVQGAMTKPIVKDGKREVGHCLVGFIDAETRRYPTGRQRNENYYAVRLAVINALLAERGEKNIIRFNDRRTTKREDVIAVLKRAIKEV